MRYDIKDEGIGGNPPETRRERNERHDIESPWPVVPPAGQHLWDWYFEISQSVRRIRNGVCEPIPPSEFLAWATLTGSGMRPLEYGILRAMDDAYREEMGKELADYEERRKEAMRNGAEQAPRSGRRGRKG